MIKTIIKLLIAVVILNGVYRGGAVAWDYYQLKDAAQQMLLFGANASTEELSGQILAKAEEQGIPLEPENLIIRRDEGRTFVHASYRQPLDYFPNVIYPLDLSFDVDAFRVEGLK